MIYRVGIELESNKTDVEESEFRENYSQPKPEPIAPGWAPYDRDLTTEEVEELERNTTGDL